MIRIFASAAFAALLAVTAMAAPTDEAAPDAGAALPPLADTCPLAPRASDQVAYLALVVGAEGIANDDAFRRAGGEPCLPVISAGN